MEFPKVCFTCYINGPCLCIADLNDGVPDDRRLQKFHLKGFDDSVNAFAFDDSRIFLFSSNRRSTGAVSLHSFRPPSEPLILEKSELCDEGLQIFPKTACKIMRYKSEFLIFSSSVQLCRPASDVNTVNNFLRRQLHRRFGFGNFDFELYDPNSKTKTALPQLSIRVSRNPVCDDDEYPYFTYELLDENSLSVIQFEGYLVSSVQIRGFTLVGGGGDVFTVQTNLGRIFMINLSSSKPVWELGVEDWDWEGGLCRHMSRFFVIDDVFCIDGHGIYRRRKIEGEDDILNLWEKHYVEYEGVTPENLERIRSTYKLDFHIRSKAESVDRRIPLLPTTTYGVPKAISLAKNLVFVVDTLPPTLTVTILKLDLTKFPELDWSSPSNFYEQIEEICRSEESQNGDWEWARKVKSVEFSLEGLGQATTEVFPLYKHMHICRTCGEHSYPPIEDLILDWDLRRNSSRGSN